MPLLPVIALFCLVALSSATTCSFANQVDDFWNPACKDPLTPYCTSIGCTKCNPDKRDYEYCDCPANQFCDRDPNSATYATCVNFPLSMVACATAANCQITIGSNSQVIGYYSCVGGFCTPCNQSASYGNATVTCPGGSPYPESSRPGETRTCGADGYWVGGGQIQTPNPSPSTNGGSSTSGGGSSSTISSGATGKVAMFALVCILISVSLINY